jgi:hypothetical protein
MTRSKGDWLWQLDHLEDLPDGIFCHLAFALLGPELFSAGGQSLG